MFSPNRKPDPAVPGIGFTASPRSSEMEQLLMRLQSMIETSRLLRHILNDESREGQSDQLYKSHSGSFDDCKYLSSKNILVTDFSVSSVRVLMMSVRCAADTLAWLQINYHPQPALTPPLPWSWNETRVISNFIFKRIFYLELSFQPPRICLVFKFWWNNSTVRSWWAHVWNSNVFFNVF